MLRGTDNTSQIQRVGICTYEIWVVGLLHVTFQAARSRASLVHQSNAQEGLLHGLAGCDFFEFLAKVQQMSMRTGYMIRCQRTRNAAEVFEALVKHRASLHATDIV